MTAIAIATATQRKPRRKHRGSVRLSKFWPGTRTRKRLVKAYRAMPPLLQIATMVTLVLSVWLSANWVYQVFRKPTELFFPVSGALYKTPTETWREYGADFEQHSTQVITPELLAALAQVEGAGNPVARTYWRWSLRPRPFEVYRPASSAVGMYQITDGTFDEAKRYCIHDHMVVEAGPLMDFNTCWFNGLYARTIASNAIELTSAYLDRAVVNTLRRNRISSATPEQKQDLAAVIHLCGAGAGDAYARRRFRLSPGQRCGDHYAQVYVGRVDAFRKVFHALREGSRER